MHTLRPYLPREDDLRIQADVRREGTQLQIGFLIAGGTERVCLPPKSPAPGRLDRLWKTTCFELFFSTPESQSYWELNFSPSGDWNCYFFEKYRTGMRLEPKISLQPIRCERDDQGIRLQASVDLSGIPGAGGSLELSAAGVIEEAQGAISYWAIRHCGMQPDFHLRESFSVRVPQ